MLLQKLDPEISQDMIRSWGWYLAFGIALSLLGVAASPTILRHQDEIHHRVEHDGISGALNVAK